MKKAAWKKKIEKACREAGTYEPFFRDTIEALAETLEKRDEVEKQYKDGGGKPVEEYTNKAGATNIVKNPILVLWNEMNRMALDYWKELGLTPAAYKRIAGEAGQRKESELERALRSLGT